MRLCIDLDGVVCTLKLPGQTYDDVVPVPGAVERLRELRAHGHVIILHTARHMKTCEGNVGQVVARIGQVTLNWLARHKVEFDELYFGKPWADIYIDDNAFRFTNWTAIDADAANLPASCEVSHADALLMPPAQR